MKHKLLIICYTFPPYEGIGGRRWAKFCKYLYKKGIEFEVIAAHRGVQSTNWVEDIEPFKDKITYIPSGYPEILNSVPNTILQKVKYRLTLFIKKKLNKGNPYDYSRHWRKNLAPVLNQKLNNGFTTVIYSMLPFRGAQFTIEFKKQFPQIQFILDVRDPWSNNRTGFGFETLSQKDIMHEIELEKQIVLQFDKICAVSAEMNNYFVNLFGVAENKVFELRNGYDLDDASIAQHSKEKQIVFVGTLYQKAEHGFKEFVNAILHIENTQPTLLSNIKFSFYGSVPSYFTQMVANSKQIEFKGKVNQKMASQIIANASATMLFLADDTNYSFSTKFYEYVCNKKPVLVIAKSGITSKFVDENGIGMEIPLGNIALALEKALQLLKANELIFNPNFDTAQYEVEHLTAELIKIIEL